MVQEIDGGIVSFCYVGLWHLRFKILQNSHISCWLELFLLKELELFGRQLSCLDIHRVICFVVGETLRIDYLFAQEIFGHGSLHSLESQRLHLAYFLLHRVIEWRQFLVLLLE